MKIGTERPIHAEKNRTGTARRFDIDITSIRRRLNFDEFPRRYHIPFST